MLVSAPHAAPHAHAVTYRQVGLETGVAAASSHQRVLLLFDAIDESPARTHGAMQSRRVETKAFSRAMRIVDEGLKADLNLSDGGSLASDLRDLRSPVCARLPHAKAHNDDAALADCRRLLHPPRDAWASIASDACRAA